MKDLRREAAALKEAVADLTLENRLLKKRMAPPRLQGGLIRLKEIVVDWAALVTNIKPKSEHPTFRVRLALGFATSLTCNATS